MNAGFDYREQVGVPGHGETVLAYLSRRYRHSGESAWRARIEGGEVLLDGAPTTPAALPL